MNKKVKVLLSKLGLDVHNRGIITIAKILRNEGMEVIYIGNALPEEIIETAIQEDVDVIGVSSLGGAHLTLGSELIEKAKIEGIINTIVFQIGGVIPPEDVIKLKKAGFDGVFTPGTKSEDIISAIKDAMSHKISL